MNSAIDKRDQILIEVWHTFVLLLLPFANGSSVLFLGTGRWKGKPFSLFKGRTTTIQWGIKCNCQRNSSWANWSPWHGKRGRSRWVVKKLEKQYFCCCQVTTHPTSFFSSKNALPCSTGFFYASRVKSSKSQVCWGSSNLWSFLQILQASGSLFCYGKKPNSLTEKQDLKVVPSISMKK